MRIVTMYVSELQPAPYNPRLELSKNSSQYRKLKRSIERFGLVEPLLWNKRTGLLVGGHQRLRVLQDLKIEKVSVSVLDLSPEQEKALNIVLNNREAQSDWDLPQLTSILEELAELPESLLFATGFEPSHLKTLQSELTPSEEPMVDEEVVGKYEITLCISMAQLAVVRGDLDALIDRYQLETHIRHR